ncbi:MAG: ferric reductase-like transmembrane domain-containing protein [Actinobacteria bacterium]|nr:ferric reductase-like transmembrane domain-containing protein [Actinomycetota bacterium]
MLIAAATAGPSVLWYLARGTGVVALLLLTTSVVLGVLNVRRVSTANLPRFVFDGLHRSVSLLVLAVLGVHILASVLDSFVSIGLVTALVPFNAGYRPLWLGLGAIAFELLVAVAITSLLRQRIGYRAWRAVHWLAYAAWPVALVHGFGTGTDSRTGWMLLVTAVCLLAVIAAVLARAASGWPADRPRRLAAGAFAVLSPIVLVAWLLDGPLASGWARRAGTPVALLAASRPVEPAPATLALPFTAQVTGRIAQTSTTAGVVVRIALADAAGRSTAIRIVGQPSSAGGVLMTDSLVRVGTRSQPGLYRGRILSLSGGNLIARLTSGGHHARLDASLQINGATVGGTTTMSLTG